MLLYNGKRFLHMTYCWLPIDFKLASLYVGKVAFEG